MNNFTPILTPLGEHTYAKPFSAFVATSAKEARRREKVGVMGNPHVKTVLGGPLPR
jgi:hypothetical protein